MTNPHLIDKEIASATGTIARGIQISVDSSALGSVDAANTQELASELNRLFAIVSGGQPGQPNPRFQGPFVPFTSSVNIGAANFDLFTGNTALYARSDNARVNFILPTDAEITAQGVASDETVEYAVLNQAGTGRFDTGFTPTNTVIIDVEGANNIRRNTPTGTLLNFIEAHQNDLVTLTQAGRGQPWVAVRVTLSSAALLLPSGLFRLQVGVTLNPIDSLGFLTGLPAGTTPQAGDAYLIGRDNETFGGYGVAQGDVIVALQDSPSLAISETNDDWIVIRNATNDIISLSEIFFLNTITETDNFVDDRLMDRSDVNDVRVFLSTGILDHAPFITPSTDGENPQTSNGARYVGGSEDRSAGNDFHLTDFTKVGEPAGSSRFPNALVYFDIDGAFDVATLLNQVNIVVKDRTGAVVSTDNAIDHFRPVVLPGSTDTYYVLDRVGASDNYSSINYLSGYTIEVVFRRTIRHFTFSDAVNVLGAIADGSIEIGKLHPDVQALITSDHSLTDDQEAKLNGFQTSGTPTPWTSGDLYVRETNASPTSDAGHYYNVGQQNGILSNHDSTRAVTFVVPNFVTVTQLQRTDDTTIKHPVTRLGAITIQDNTVNPPRTFNGQGFSAVLPASGFDINNPIGNIWQVDGTASNLELTGADDSFKVHVGNLGQDVLDRTAPTTPATLPDVLQSLSHDLTRVTRTLTGWRTLGNPIRSDLSRQFAALWDENRNTFTTNYFEDIPGVEFIGFQGNNIFFYASGPNDQSNFSFPGAQSYILNSNIRVRNESGQTAISDSFRKIIAFDYALQRTLSTENLPMLRVGSTSATPLMGLSEEEGLYLNIGREDGTQQSRTYESSLQVDGAHLHSNVDESFVAESEIIIPDSLTGSLTLRVRVQLDNNGNDEGTHLQVITINDLDTDQNIGSRTWGFGPVYPNLVGGVEYEHENNDLSTPRRVLIFTWTTPLDNASLTYNVAASRLITETWTHPNTYARFPINAGNAHDDFGIFDPHRWNTEHVRERNRVLFVVGKYRESDSDSNPELAVRVIVDGEIESSGNLIRLHRPASDFTFKDISFGNNEVAVSHIQCYDYDPGTSGQLVPTSTELQTLYAAANRWFGAFTDSDAQTSEYDLAAGLKLSGDPIASRPFIVMTEAQRDGLSLGDNDNDRWRLVMNTTAGKLQIWSGTDWQDLN